MSSSAKAVSASTSVVQHMYLCMYIIHVHVYYNSVEGKWITVSVMLFDCKSGSEWEGRHE